MRQFFKDKASVLLIFFVSLLAIVIRGYQFGVNDQVLHLPYIFKIMDSNLYGGDYLFLANNNPQANITIYYQLLAIVNKFTGIGFESLSLFLYSA